jgi:hypothetical protein
MPNHVYSSLSIAGKREELEKIRDDIHERVEEDGKKLSIPFSFNKIIPMPSHIFRGSLSKAEEDKYGKENCWYQWSLANWGTKWNAYEQPGEPPDIETGSNAVKFIKGEDTTSLITYTFSTAWSPVPMIIETLSEKYPEALFRYTFVDEGGSFAACEFYKYGEVLEENDCTGDEEAVEELQRKLKFEELMMEFKRVIQEHF